MTVETLPQGTKSMRHRRALEAYVAKLEDALRRRPRDGASSGAVTIDGVSLSLEPWIAARLNPLGGGHDDDSGRTELVRQAVALWLKITVDVRNLGAGSQNGSGNLYELQAELMLDSAFGSSVLRELQDSVDGLVKQGELEEARKLSKLQRELRGVLKDMKQTIAESSGMSAEALFAQPVERKPAPVPMMERILVEADFEDPAPRPQRRPKPKAAAAGAPGSVPGLSRTKLLLALNSVALLTCLIVTAPLLMLGEPPRVLALGDFPDVAPLVEVQAHPPALYAVVDGKTWSSFDEKHKRRFVDGMGSVLLTEGYWGMVVKTPDGRLVADWLEQGGARLLEPQEGEPLNVADAPALVQAEAKAPAVAAQYSRFIP